MINISLIFVPKEGMRIFAYNGEKYVGVDLFNEEFENNNLLQFAELLSIRFTQAYERLKEHEEMENEGI